jgi:hypothetical protein
VADLKLPQLRGDRLFLAVQMTAWFCAMSAADTPKKE